MTKTLTYLALPYTGTEEDTAERVRLMTVFDTWLMRSGCHTVSPIYKHLMLLNDVTVPGDWDYWKGYSENLLGRCTTLIVLCLPGWQESMGVQAEIQIAEDLGLEILHAKRIGETDSFELETVS